MYKINASILAMENCVALPCVIKVQESVTVTTKTSLLSTPATDKKFLPFLIIQLRHQQHLTFSITD